MLFIVIVHSLVCVFLIILILMQSGRGGGLTESFAAAESVFGAKTNEFLVRATIVFSGIFLLTSISLAHMSARKQKSLMERLKDVKTIDLGTIGDKKDGAATTTTPATDTAAPTTQTIEVTTPPAEPVPSAETK